MLRRSLVLLFLAAVAVRADEVELAGGGRLSGQIVAETDDAVTLRLAAGTMEIPRARIVRIVREDEVDYLRREGRARLRNRQARSAVDLLARALEHDPKDVATRRDLTRALYAHAVELAQAFRLPEARAEVARAQELFPDHPDLAALAAEIDRVERQAAELHAHAVDALRAGRLRDALALLDAWRLRRPAGDEQVAAELAAAHLAAARQAQGAGDLRSALDHYRMAERYGAREEAARPLYLLRPVAVLEALRQGDLEQARRLLDGIATTYPDAAVPVFLSAVASHMQGRVAEAVAAYAEAARLAEAEHGTRAGLSYEVVRRQASQTLRAAIARPPEEGVSTWRELFLKPLQRDESSPHFVVYAASADGAAATAEAATRVYEAIATDLLGAQPGARRAEVVIHPTRQAYLAADPSPPGTPLAELTVGRDQTRGCCYDTVDEEGKPLIRIEVDGESPGWLADILPHEIVHVVQRQGLPAFRKGHWLDEGLAMLYESPEGQRQRTEQWQAARAQRLALPELVALQSTPPDRVGLFYLESFAFTTWLRARGDEDQWRRFLAVLGTSTLEEAARDAWGVPDLQALERAWEQSLAQ